HPVPDRRDHDPRAGPALVFPFSPGLVDHPPPDPTHTNSVSGISMMILIPLTFAGNIFVGPHIMSGWLRAFVELNPGIHRARAVGGLTAGTGAAGAAGWVLACAVLTAVFAPLTMRLYRPGRVGRCADLQLRAVVGGAVGQVGAVPGDDLPDPQRGQR